MDWKKRYNDNTAMISLYMQFMQHKSLSANNALKLMTEIGRLNTYNVWIENMSIEDYMLPVQTINIHQDSKL